MRGLLLAMQLLAAAPQTAAEAPPAVLLPYVRGGMFEPGDYRWLRGQFDGASAADQADNAAILGWRKRCRAEGLAQTRAELAGMGITAGASLQAMPYRTLICSQVATLPEPLDRHDWDRFVRDVETVRPMAQGFLAAVVLAEQAAAPDGPGLREALSARFAGDQILRRGLDWASGGTPDAPALSLTAQQRGILASQIAMAMTVRDHANTAWMKTVVATEGWPTRTKVGAEAANVAWLLVQHADADPAFQARALRLMQPLVATGEVTPRNYAYLYDRVMLRLVGKQRYATQLTCQGGRSVPQPLEDERRVEQWRREAGLASFAEYQRKAARELGPCP